MFLLKINLNIWKWLGLAIILLLCFIFFKVLIYIGISLVLFLLGFPLTYRMEKIKIGKFKFPDGIAALVTVLILLGLVSALFLIIIPPLVGEVKFLTGLNFYDVMHNILAQFPDVKKALLRLGTEHDLEQNLVNRLNQLVNTSNIADVVNNLFGYLSTIIGGALCVLFITFFFLKDEEIVRGTVLLLTPPNRENEMSDIMRTSKVMLSKYFVGLFTDMLIVGVLVMTLLTILGIKNAVLISFVAAVMNVIPYIGSLITMIIAIFLGVSGCISINQYELIGPTINKIFFGLLSVNLLDGIIIQPFIFSSSVKAHPLEVFIVTLMAATIGGIPGMIVALPAYTLFRIVAKEFLTHLKFFKKITENITGD